MLLKSKVVHLNEAIVVLNTMIIKEEHATNVTYRKEVWVGQESKDSVPTRSDDFHT